MCQRSAERSVSNGRSNASILRPQDPFVLFLIAIHVINDLAIRVDNDDYRVAFDVGSHIDVVFLVRPTHHVPEAILPRFDCIYFRVSMI